MRWPEADATIDISSPLQMDALAERMTLEVLAWRASDTVSHVAAEVRRHCAALGAASQAHSANSTTA